MLAGALAGTAANLDGWVVSAWKVAYLTLNGAGWGVCAAGSGLLRGVDWLVRVAMQMVSVLCIPGQRIRARVFRAA
jgi:hypothetical protein